MVKLPNEEDISECDNMVMFYYNNQRVYTHRGPIGLLDLEQIAGMAVNYSYVGAITTNRYVQQMAINRVRQLFNMEFKMVCDYCGVAHYQDEITAPER